MTKVLPYLDDFINNDKICDDINNPEDLNLIHNENWDYEITKKSEEAQNDEPEKDSSDEHNEDDIDRKSVV